MEQDELEQLIESVVRGETTIRECVDRLIDEMGRGPRVLVVDENAGLEPALSKIGYHTVRVKKGTLDSAIKPQLVSKILVTRSVGDFDDPESMTEHYYGIIHLVSSGPPDVLAKKVSQAIMKSGFKENLVQVVKA